MKIIVSSCIAAALVLGYTGNLFATVQCPETIVCKGTGTETGTCTSTIANWVGSFQNYISPVSGTFTASWTTGGGNAQGQPASCYYAYPDANGNTVVSIIPNNPSAYTPDTKSPGSQWVLFGGGQWACGYGTASPSQCKFLVNGK